MPPIGTQVNKLRDSLFQKIHKHNLVYNTCWEDPRCDRELLQLNEQSQVVMIASAGCNTLDYLLDQPAQIHALDVNPKQTALLALKLATFTNGTYEDLYKLFGQGYHPDAEVLYKEKLRPILSEYAQSYWDKKIKCFRDKHFKGSFYYYGTSGHFAWLFNQYLKVKPDIREKVNQLLEARTVEEQSAIYREIEPKIIPSMVEWLLNRHLTMAMLGVPRPQRHLILDQYPGGLSTYIRDSLRKVFAYTALQDNYFWRIYLKGEYTKDCCPNYLKETNFETIRNQVSKINNKASSISDFLKENPGQYTHYVLLDHQDWLASHSPKALEVEWQLILANSIPGTKILFRSAAKEVNFIPEFVQEAVTFHKVNPNDVENPDRVGTYGSAYLGVVQ